MFLIPAQHDKARFIGVESLHSLALLAPVPDFLGLFLLLGGTAYFVADIGLRMLTPRELYNAMGFPPDYIIDRDYTGRAYGKSKQVARCGNAVCPPMAEAVVRANLPEWCGKKLRTMEELEREVSA